MIDLMLSGACGKMGNAVANAVKNNDKFNIVCGVDKNYENSKYDFEVFETFDKANLKPDVIIDFSSPEMLDGLLDFAVNKKVPAVIATTGFSEEQINKIKSAAEKIPVFFTFNLSLGINLLKILCRKAAEILGADFDIEIIEKHHNQKLDAPSGTALMLADSINEASQNKYNYEFDRHSRRMKRPENEIGFHSVRGGTIVGEHEVIFAGNDEVITISHEAYSKAIFANGALKAAEFIKDKKSGLYNMEDILK